MRTKTLSSATRLFGWFVLGWMLLGPRVHAQGLGLGVTSSTASVQVSNTVTFTVNFTNRSTIQLFEVTLTNSPSDQVLLVDSTLPGTTNAAGDFVIPIGLLNPAAFGQIVLTVRPLFAGTLTNRFILSTTSALVEPAVTNIIVEVTNVPVVQIDLAVSIAPPSTPVVENDLTTYSVSVTNLGTNSVSGVVLSNTLPTGVGFIGVSPANQVTQTTNAVLLSVGTLTNSTSRTFQLTIWPTNAGPLTLGASVFAPGTEDANTTNNTATAEITVAEIVEGQLVASNITEMTLNRQTGLMEQTIRVSNVGTTSVAAVRVIITGLTNRLYNAAGTNDGHPFVGSSAPLETNQSVDLVLEYFIPRLNPIVVSNSAYIAFGVPASDLSATNPAGTDITKILQLTDGSILIEFSSMPGRSYTIFYATNMDFENALMAQPSIIAPADRTQWIDDGPPKTISVPPDANSRLYRVRLNP